MNDNFEKISFAPQMISYAQNFEDVVLQRALSEVSNGFYIDAGAGDPIIDSVTKHFYDAGWNGINIEPHPVCFQALENSRIRDKNLNCSASNLEGKEDFYLFKHTGFSTSIMEIAEHHISQNHIFDLGEIQTTTLNNIFEIYVQGREVHFLKIDVEGSEKQVLEGIDLMKNRPWIIVVEATIPNTQIDNSWQWERLVTRFRYELVYRDGLNHFYLSKEHKLLKHYFEFPPNVFDNFEKYYAHRGAELDRLIARNLELRDKFE